MNLSEIKAREQKATKGPWMARIGAAPCGCCDVIAAKKIKHLREEVDVCERVYDTNDSEFIAHSRTDVPELVRAVEELRSAITFISNMAWMSDYPSTKQVLVQLLEKSKC